MTGVVPHPRAGDAPKLRPGEHLTHLSYALTRLSWFDYMAAVKALDGMLKCNSITEQEHAYLADRLCTAPRRFRVEPVRQPKRELWSDPHYDPLSDWDVPA